MELAAVVLALVAYAVDGAYLFAFPYGTLVFLSGLAMLWYALLIGVYDYRHKIIPNSWVAALIVIGLLRQALAYIHVLPSEINAFFFVPTPVLDFFGGVVVALPLALLWLASKGRAIGLGDAKLLLALGTFFGFSGALTLFALSFWIGTIPSIVLLLMRPSRSTMKRELAFAPCIVLAALLMYAFDINIFNWTW